MALSEKKFNYLSEMGIDLWQQRDDGNMTTSEKKTEDNYLSIEHSAIEHSRLFDDVLTALTLTKGDYTIKSTTITFEFFDWHFSKGNDISFENSKLVTPPLSTIGLSTLLKKGLWQQLQTFN